MSSRTGFIHPREPRCLAPGPVAARPGDYKRRAGEARRRPEFAQGFSRTVVIPCRLGLHLRVATAVVIMARRFHADIYFATARGRVDAKSILSMLGLGAVRGTSLTLTARGQDADRALRVLGDLFESPTVLCKDGPAMGATEPAAILAGAAVGGYNVRVY